VLQDYVPPHRRFSVAVLAKVQWHAARGVAKWRRPAVAAGSLAEMNANLTLVNCIFLLSVVKKLQIFTGLTTSRTA
jgi:hypothetical protein